MGDIMRVAAISILLGLAAAAQAQVLSPKSAANIPVSPEVIDQRIVDAAADIGPTLPANASIPRVALYDFGWPKDQLEAAGLGKHGVMLISAITRTEAELPIRRVYIRLANGAERVLEKISVQRLDVPKGAAQMLFGRFREDSLYIAPLDTMTQEGGVFAEFSNSDRVFRASALPAQTPGWWKSDGRPSERPNAQALAVFMKREFSGYAFSSDWK
jgi:hypothetical protein